MTDEKTGRQDQFSSSAKGPPESVSHGPCNKLKTAIIPEGWERILEKIASNLPTQDHK